MLRNVVVFSLAVLPLLAGSAQPAAASFELLGQFPHPDYPSSRANAVSADGQVVVGESRMEDSLYNFAPFRWAAAGGLVEIGAVPPNGNGVAYDVSADGSVVVGELWDGVGVGEAYRWTQEDGAVILASPPAWQGYDKIATGVSADGSVLVGIYDDSRGAKGLFRWTEGEGMLDLGPVVELAPNGGPHISADGLVIVANDAERGAFRWREDTGRVYLGILPGAAAPPLAFDVSDDGSVIVGSVRYDIGEPGDQGFCWTEQEGLVLLFGGPREPDSTATGVSGDGSLVVGVWDDSFDGFIWDSTHGARDLRQVLEDHCGLDIGTFSLKSPSDISPDGRVIVGTGEGAQGFEAWRVVIPEPSTAVLLIAGMLAVLWFQRRKGNATFVHVVWEQFTRALGWTRNPRVTFRRPTRLAFEALEDRRLLTAIVRGPYLQEPGFYPAPDPEDPPVPNSMVIVWKTDYASDSRVEYRVGEALWESVEDSQEVQFHEVPLSGLDADTDYQYRVTSYNGTYGSVTSPQSTFHTAPDTERSFRFAVYGDTRSDTDGTKDAGPDYHGAVVDGIIRSQPEFVLHVGDFVNTGRDAAQWDPQFFGPAHDLMINTPLFPAWGNHEYNGTGELLVDNYFAPPPVYPPPIDPSNVETWYAFTYSNIRFVVLDTYDPGEFDTTGDSPERDWLLEEVQKPEFTAADWQIVVFHNPPYSSDAASDAVKTHLVPVFRANGVDMVFSGHAHFYERYEYQKYGYANDPIVQYIVTGGGGAPLVPIGAEPTDDDVERVCELKAFHHTIIDVDVPGKSLTLTAVDINGTPFDTVTLTLDGPRQLSQEAPPTAQLISPSDGLSDPEDEFEDDFDRDPNEVLVNTAPTSFKIQLVDPDEIDDDSVTSSAVRIVKDGVTMSPSDYVFEYQVQQDDQIRLTRPGGAAFDRGVYEIRLNDTPTITDTQDCAMLPTVLTVVVEPSWGSVDLVPEGSTWEYLVTPSEPSPDQGGNTWRDPLFDHSWPSGAAQLGYSYDPPENDEATFLGFGGNPNDKYITTYFRHTFNVDKTSNHLDLLSLSLVRDDGAIVYLNGIEVKRTNMPTTGTIGWSSLASGGVGGTEESTWREPLALDPSLLVQGSNVLAVEIHQRSATSSDISLDLELKAFGSKITTNAFDPEVGLLEVYGTTGDDEIALSVNGSDHVTLNGQELSGPVDADDVTEIKVYGYAGNDTIDLSGVDDADFTALAASGAVRIEGGAGNDAMIGSANFGETYVFSGSGLGSDSINSAAGAFGGHEPIMDVWVAFVFLQASIIGSCPSIPRFVEERLLPPVSPLRHMVGHPRNNQPRQPCHAPSVSKSSKSVNN